jgi:hypothetical protein
MVCVYLGVSWAGGPEVCGVVRSKGLLGGWWVDVDGRSGCACDVVQVARLRAVDICTY